MRPCCSLPEPPRYQARALSLSFSPFPLQLRPKWVEIESAKLVPGRPHYFVLELRTQVREGRLQRCSTTTSALPSVDVQAVLLGAAAVKAWC